jgi:uncharacterized membrane-anchored protein
MLIVNVFGFTLAAGALLTSIAMITMGEKWQNVERRAYAGNKRPWWFVLVSILLIAFYIAALINFWASEKTIAGLILMIIIPIGWGLKAILIVLNPSGRQKVSAISGDKAWIKIGLARLPIAVILFILALFA